MGRDLIDRLLELIYPSGIYCISCGKPIGPGFHYALCPVCMKSIKWANGSLCRICGKSLYISKEGLCEDCIEFPRSFDRGFSCVEYGIKEKEIIHRFKYKDKDYYASKLALLMYDRICPEDLGVDLVVPVPMYKPKEKRRGYNQAALLAKALARLLNKPFRSDMLLRVKDTLPMSNLSAEQRRTNLKGAFAVTKSREKVLFDKTVLLVDDVFTTGNTADACSLALKDAGAVKVYVATFASGVGSV